MKWNPSAPKKPARPKTVRKTIVIDCFSGAEYEADPKRIQIIDGMEIGSRVELDNGVKLAVVGDGKYHTFGNPKERWAEVAQVPVLPDGEYGDGELLGWTPLFAKTKPASSAEKSKKAAGNSVKKPGRKKQAGKRPISQKPSAADGKKLPPRPKKKSQKG